MISQTRLIMGMPITVMVHDGMLSPAQIERMFDLFTLVDKKYSPYRDDSEVSRLQKIPLLKRRYSPELASIMRLAEETKRATNGYFDVEYNGTFDPSGIVKGWAIQQAAQLLETMTDNFYVEAGGDIQVRGVSEHGEPWQIGIRNPFKRSENVAVVALNNAAIATSGTAIRGAHIYDPVNNQALSSIVSLSVIAPSIVDADRMATAAFAMSEKGIYFIEKLPGYEAFVIDANGISTQTTGWKDYEVAV